MDAMNWTNEVDDEDSNGVKMMIEMMALMVNSETIVTMTNRSYMSNFSTMVAGCRFELAMRLFMTSSTTSITGGRT